METPGTQLKFYNELTILFIVFEGADRFMIFSEIIRGHGEDMSQG